MTRLAHRGPDDQGLESFDLADGKVILGHTRLSIIDLTTGGHQPMHSQDARYVLTFNGEIYNYKELRDELRRLGHRFASDADTEVLLACWIRWGCDCLRRLRGMFAFVVFDRVALTLTCVRDAFGIKPFYYQLDRQAFLFASEIPSLLALQRQRPPIDHQRAYDYLVAGSYDDRAASFYQGIRQLPPGHVLTLNLSVPNVAELSRWWWPSIAESASLSFADAADQLRAMFLDNVRLHLRSDVALGAALSGGVDSSAIVCAMRHVEPSMAIHTFSYVARGSAVDEEHWVDLVNHYVGAIPQKIVIDPLELSDDLEDILRAQGEPFGSTSIYAQYRVYKLARERGVTVMLDGQGADELLAGYRGYPGERARSLLDNGQLLELLRFLRAWSRWPDRSVSQAVKALMAQLVPDPLQVFARRLNGVSPVPSWLDSSKLERNPLRAPLFAEELSGVSGRRLVASLRQALAGNGLNALLRHGDRNSMRWSVESRVPFLTTDLSEFVLSLPEHYLVSPSGETKHVFRAAMRGIVPPEILDRKDKIGFVTPEHVWLKAIGSKVFNWLDAAEMVPFLDAAACRREVRAILDGRRTFSYQAWRLINFCQWARASH